MHSSPGTRTIQGIAASAGIAIGSAVWRRKERIQVIRYAIAEQAIEAELSRLNQAVETAKRQIHDLREVTARQVGESEAQIFDAHASFLEDPSYVGAMREQIRNHHLNAEAVCEQITEETRQMLASLQDEYLQARADDIRDVGNRLLALLSGNEGMEHSDLPQNAIVLAEELTPADLVHLPKTIAGIVTARGSKTGHVAIMATTLGIPAVLGIQGQIEELSDGDLLIVDGGQGVVLVRPDEITVRHMQEKLQMENEAREGARQVATERATTVDGEAIEVFANIGNLHDLDEAVANGAEGVGLFRTEFLYIENDHWPTETEQFEAYKTVLERFQERPVIIRTLDIGGDKELPYAKFSPEENPFLGNRALRFCLTNPEIFKIQLRALLRASIYGSLWVMFPMVTTVAEIRQAKVLLQECAAELQREGVAISNKIPVGIMVETPSSAIMADVLAQEIDFMSIGTNDLTQYTLAADRGNEQVAHLYNAHHPAVLRLIRSVCEAGQQVGIPVGVCGEMGGDRQFTELLIGLGVNELSMSARSIPQVKQTIRQIRIDEARTRAQSALVQVDAPAVAAFLGARVARD